MSADDHHSNAETNSDSDLPVADLSATEVEGQSAEQVKGGSIVRLVDASSATLWEAACGGPGAGPSPGAGASAGGTGNVAK